ncbi:hypothetical protein RND81_13G117500 [Saponaria officinalis]|uniref:Uncharacterized protein n=1 Tax=Saponaria officinalis TaxID=3572 RepID=A0AAW1H5W8_SAPOF
MASEIATEESPAPVEMDLESETPDDNTEIIRKRDREDAENGTENDAVLKKHKVEDTNEEEKSVEEVRMEKKTEENVGPVGLGHTTFATSVEMFDYFYKLLHHWPINFRVNKYEYVMLLDLIKKGHQEPDKKIGSGIKAIEIRYHPKWQSRCFFVVRDDNSAEDFSFRKCVDHILPLPENMKIKSEVNKVLGGKGSGKKGGGGGGGGGGRGGGGRGRGWGGRSKR